MVLGAVGIVTGGGLAALSPAAADHSPPVISWPSIAQLNPTSTPYTVTVAYDGPDHLFMTMSAPLTFTTQPLASDAATTLVFPADRDGVVTLEPALCPTATYSAESCEQVDDRRNVVIYDEYVVEIFGDAASGTPDRRGPGSPFGISVKPDGSGTVDVAWEVVPANAPDAAPLVEGLLDDVPPRGQLPGIGVTDALVDGQQYLYRATFSGEVSPYGPLVGVATNAFTWDGANEATGIQFRVDDGGSRQPLRDVDVFYPVHDLGPYRHWRDYLYVDVLPKEREPVSLDLAIRNSLGTVVREISGDGTRGWDGRGPDRRVVPEGTYTVEATVTDRRGNVETYEQDVRVSQERIEHATWTTTVLPKRTMIERFVGRCASIKVPARAPWRGSIGLRSSKSGSGCRTLAAQSVTAVHGIYLPRSPIGRYDLYDRVQVSAYGGAARGADSAYLVHWYWSRGKEWVSRSQFDRRLRWHDGQMLGSNVVLGDPDEENPFVIWSVGLAEGAKYDVKRYRVSVRYWVLRYR